MIKEETPGMGPNPKVEGAVSGGAGRGERPSRCVGSDSPELPTSREGSGNLTIGIVQLPHRGVQNRRRDYNTSMALPSPVAKEPGQPSLIY